MAAQSFLRLPDFKTENDYKSSLNKSYDMLMSCSLYELVNYWTLRAEELIEEAEMRYEDSRD